MALLTPADFKENFETDLDDVPLGRYLDDAESDIDRLFGVLATQTDSVAGDIVHVTDLFTTIARLGGASNKVPTDRIIDGIDQTSLMLNGETHGRRDYVFLYNINKLEAVVKEQYKLAIPGGNMDNAIMADFYDLFRDPQERYPVSTEIGAWGGAKFVRMIQRHMKRKAKYPDERPATGMPYEGIENLRPESKAAVQEFLFMMKTPEM